jgi:hypothetical protein
MRILLVGPASQFNPGLAVYYHRAASDESDEEMLRSVQHDTRFFSKALSLSKSASDAKI